MPYKGWVPVDTDLVAIRAFLADAQRQHQMVICDDPRPAVAALGRTLPDKCRLPSGLRACWSPKGPERFVHSR
jgi:hypothetical protein